MSTGKYRGNDASVSPAAFRTKAPAGDGGRSRALSPDETNQTFARIGEKLRSGLSAEAGTLLENTVANYDHGPDDLANLKRLQAFTFETLGQYKPSLEALRPYEDEDNLKRLNLETQVRVATQLAISYNNLGDHPRAVTLLKETLKKAVDNELTHLSGGVDIGLARVYRKLNECPIGRGYAEKALDHFREQGNWLGMAEAYREIALSFHQEGNSARSIEFFNLGIQIIGDNSAPFMLGKLYTDMSGAYWFLRRPLEGVQCLEKSIKFFDQTEHVLNSVIAYNNLGLNLIIVGDLARAEKMIRRALDLAIKSKHSHVAGILDSLSELKIMRGDLDEAEKYLHEAVSVARERNREWYEAQALRNLARVYLAKGYPDKAIETARETIELSSRIGEKHYSNMAGLVLAESLLETGAVQEAENYLKVVEESDQNSDFYLLGSIQRIRGVAALKTNDLEMALHHFNRSLTIFEAAGDMFNSGYAHLIIGSNTPPENRVRAVRHLTVAGEIFKKLDLKKYVDEVDEVLASLQTRAAVKADTARGAEGRRNSVVSQLLMVRLAEATASHELLFRELMAVLQQESRAKRIMIAELDDSKRYVPFITHGFSPEDSSSLIAKFNDSVEKGDERSFARVKNVAVFDLRSTAAKPAVLIIQPQSGAALLDESSLQPLLRVVELGMDVVALREKDKSTPVELETSPYISNSLMPGFIHSSPAMTDLVEEVYKIRSSDVTVLVTGESGTGKELVSRAIHTISTRKDKIFIPFNCTAIPKELAEGHLFGYRKGAFTGAVTDSPGMIRAADGGTLFLDEIGDLPLDVQPKLLRFLQEGEVQPIGEKKPIKVDVRVIAATNMPLEEKVEDGTFREDLFYRLNVIRLRVPPLRERRGEIPPIVNYYVNHYSSRFGKHNIKFSPQIIDLLMVCNWDGNVRQLCNEIQRIVARAVDNEVITPGHLSPDLKRSAKPITTFGDSDNVRPIASYDNFFSLGSGTAGGTLEDAVSGLEMQMIKDSLNRHNWNISRVAGELGLTRRGLYLKLSRYGIEKAA